jgi:hypothetical protein
MSILRVFFQLFQIKLIIFIPNKSNAAIITPLYDHVATDPERQNVEV